MVGGPLMVSLNEQLLQPTVGYSVVFGGVHGYIEAYGAGVGALTAKYEIAANEKSEAILEADVPPRLAGAGDTRAIFTRILPSRQLPPGQYVLRVTLKAGDDAVKVATRTFEVAAPAVLMTSASTPSTLSVRGEVYLPVSEQALSREFNRSDASRAATVRTFRDRVPEPSRAAFDKGVRAFSSGSYTEAEQSFKSAITADEESGAAIAYLAATFAAAGHDDAAAGAWQTALIGDAEIPEIYEWLAGALLRTRDLAHARTTLEEAIAKWPSDPRFARPMALVYATFGQGDQAVRSLERHHRRAQRRYRSAVPGRRVDLSAPLSRGRGSFARRRREAREKLRGRLREDQGPAAGARQAVDGVSGKKVVGAEVLSALVLEVRCQGASVPQCVQCVVSVRALKHLALAPALHAQHSRT